MSETRGTEVSRARSPGRQPFQDVNTKQISTATYPPKSSRSSGKKHDTFSQPLGVNSPSLCTALQTKVREQAEVIVELQARLASSTDAEPRVIEQSHSTVEVNLQGQLQAAGSEIQALRKALAAAEASNRNLQAESVAVQHSRAVAVQDAEARKSECKQWQEHVEAAEARLAKQQLQIAEAEQNTAKLEEQMAAIVDELQAATASWHTLQDTILQKSATHPPAFPAASSAASQGLNKSDKLAWQDTREVQGSQEGGGSCREAGSEADQEGEHATATAVSRAVQHGQNRRVLRNQLQAVASQAEAIAVAHVDLLARNQQLLQENQMLGEASHRSHAGLKALENCQDDNTDSKSERKGLWEAKLASLQAELEKWRRLEATAQDELLETQEALILLHLQVQRLQGQEITFEDALQQAQEALCLQRARDAANADIAPAKAASPPNTVLPAGDQPPANVAGDSQEAGNVSNRLLEDSTPSKPATADGSHRSPLWSILRRWAGQGPAAHTSPGPITTLQLESGTPDQGSEAGHAQAVDPATTAEIPVRQREEATGASAAVPVSESVSRRDSPSCLTENRDMPDDSSSGVFFVLGPDGWVALSTIGKSPKSDLGSGKSRRITPLGRHFKAIEHRLNTPSSRLRGSPGGPVRKLGLSPLRPMRPASASSARSVPGSVSSLSSDDFSPVPETPVLPSDQSSSRNVILIYETAEASADDSPAAPRSCSSVNRRRRMQASVLEEGTAEAATPEGSAGVPNTLVADGAAQGSASAALSAIAGSRVRLPTPHSSSYIPGTPLDSGEVSASQGILFNLSPVFSASSAGEQPGEEGQGETPEADAGEKDVGSEYEGASVDALDAWSPVCRPQQGTNRTRNAAIVGAQPSAAMDLLQYFGFPEALSGTAPVVRPFVGDECTAPANGMSAAVEMAEQLRRALHLMEELQEARKDAAAREAELAEQVRCLEQHVEDVDAAWEAQQAGAAALQAKVEALQQDLAAAEGARQAAVHQCQAVLDRCRALEHAATAPILHETKSASAAGCSAGVAVSLEVDPNDQDRVRLVITENTVTLPSLTDIEEGLLKEAKHTGAMLQAAEARLNRLEQERQMVAAAQAAAKEQRASLQAQCEMLGAELQRTQNESRCLRADKESTERRLARALQQCDRLEERAKDASRAESLLDAVRQNVSTLEARLASAQAASTQQTRDEAVEAELQSAQLSLASMKTELAEHQAECKGLNEALQKAASDLRDANAKSSSLERQLMEQRRELDRLSMVAVDDAKQREGGLRDALAAAAVWRERHAAAAANGAALQTRLLAAQSQLDAESRNCGRAAEAALESADVVTECDLESALHAERARSQNLEAACRKAEEDLLAKETLINQLLRHMAGIDSDHDPDQGSSLASTPARPAIPRAVQLLATPPHVLRTPALARDFYARLPAAPHRLADANAPSCSQAVPAPGQESPTTPRASKRQEVSRHGGQKSSEAQSVPGTAERQLVARLGERLGGEHGELDRKATFLRAIDRLESLQVENGRLWRILEERAAAEDQPSAQEQQGVPDLAALCHERDKLHEQLQALRAKRHDLAESYEAAQDTIQQLQRTLARLSAENASLAKYETREAGAASASLEERCQRLHQEKKVLKAVCKLALTVATDYVSGSCESAAVAAAAATQITAHWAALQSLGLAAAWTSLQALANRVSSRQVGASSAATTASSQAARGSCATNDNQQTSEGSAGNSNASRGMRLGGSTVQGKTAVPRLAVGGLQQSREGPSTARPSGVSVRERPTRALSARRSDDAVRLRKPVMWVVAPGKLVSIQGQGSRRAQSNPRDRAPTSSSSARQPQVSAKLNAEELSSEEVGAFVEMQRKPALRQRRAESASRERSAGSSSFLSSARKPLPGTPHTMGAREGTAKRAPSPMQAQLGSPAGGPAATLQLSSRGHWQREVASEHPGGSEEATSRRRHSQGAAGHGSDQSRNQHSAEEMGTQLVDHDMQRQQSGGYTGLTEDFGPWVVSPELEEQRISAGRQGLMSAAQITQAKARAASIAACLDSIKVPAAWTASP